MYLSAAQAAAEEERRRKGEVLQDGERIHFNITVMDGAPASSAAYDSLAPEIRPVAQAYDEMVRDLTQRGADPAGKAADSDVASAFGAMVADLHRNSR